MVNTISPLQNKYINYIKFHFSRHFSYRRCCESFQTQKSGYFLDNDFTVHKTLPSPRTVMFSYVLTL